MIHVMFPAARHIAEFAYGILGIKPKEFKTIKSEEELKVLLRSSKKIVLYVTLERKPNVGGLGINCRRNDPRMLL